MAEEQKPQFSERGGSFPADPEGKRRMRNKVESTKAPGDSSREERRKEKRGPLGPSLEKNDHEKRSPRTRQRETSRLLDRSERRNRGVDEKGRLSHRGRG